jgi:hypothetical protein
LESDEQLSQWLVEFQSRLVLLYTPADWTNMNSDRWHDKHWCPLSE